MTARLPAIFATILVLVVALTLPKHSWGHPENSIFATTARMYHCRRTFVEEEPHESHQSKRARAMRRIRSSKGDAASLCHRQQKAPSHLSFRRSRGSRLHHR